MIGVDDPDVDDDFAGALEISCSSGRGVLRAATREGLAFDADAPLRFRGPKALVQKALAPLTYRRPGR